MRFFPTKEETTMIFIGTTYRKLSPKQRSDYKREMIQGRKWSSPQFDVHISKCVALASLFDDRPMWAHYITLIYFKIQSLFEKLGFKKG